MARQLTALEKQRAQYQPSLPLILQHFRSTQFVAVSREQMCKEDLRPLFPHLQKNAVYELQGGSEGSSCALRVGCLFSGGPASGGHNIITGLFDALQQIHESAELIGFLGGPSGLLENRFSLLDANRLSSYRNQGGFDLLGSGRTKIETKEQFEKAYAVCQEHRLDGLVIVGGDDSNTNAAFLAEYFLQKGCPTRVVGVPKTIDGDLRGEGIELSFGFDTACRVYSEMIGNLAKDALSSLKYFHFVKLMGRSASHVTLECALATQPNFVLIGEEKKSLLLLVQELADWIEARVRCGKNYGIVLLPEGIIEFIPEVRALLDQIQQLPPESSLETLKQGLSQENLSLLQRFPLGTQELLLLQRDPHGNPPVSQIPTEAILIEWVQELLSQKKPPVSFATQSHFLGYEGRCALPTNFDANYAYTLGFFAAGAIRDRLTGVIGAVESLHRPVSEWKIRAVPIVRLMHFEKRKGKNRAVIQKTLLDTNASYFVKFLAFRQSWEMEDMYLCPGPIQFEEGWDYVDSVPFTLRV